MVIINVFAAVDDRTLAKVTDLNLADLGHPVFLCPWRKLSYKLSLVLEDAALVSMRVVVTEEPIHRGVIAA